MIFQDRKENSLWSAIRRRIWNDVIVHMNLAQKRGYAANASPITWDQESFQVAASLKRPRPLLIDLLNILPGLSRQERCKNRVFYGLPDKIYQLWGIDVKNMSRPVSFDEKSGQVIIPTHGTMLWTEAEEGKTFSRKRRIILPLLICWRISGICGTLGLPPIVDGQPCIMLSSTTSQPN